MQANPDWYAPGMLDEQYPEGAIYRPPEIVEIPEGTVKIGEKAFFENRHIRRVILPDSLREIGPEAFSGCTSLRELQLPAQLLVIGPEAFCGCTGLEALQLPAGLAQIGDYAFCKCTNLKQVSVPENLIIMGLGAFRSTPYADTPESDEIFDRLNSTVSYPVPAGFEVFRHAKLRYFLREDVTWEKAQKQFRSIGELELDGEIMDRILRYRAGDGTPVIRICEDVPTFDYADSLYDGHKFLYLAYINGVLEGKLEHGGYCGAEVSFYHNLRCADRKTERILRYSGLPLPDADDTGASA